jgi:trehalose/maltose hydrolase-like predicted phosphorylase
MSKLALDNVGATAASPLSLLDVIPPDEYQDHVNNSAYTNMGAIATLTYAASIAQLVGQAPAVYEPWLDAAARIIIPFNATGGYHPEFDGYVQGVWCGWLPSCMESSSLPDMNSIICCIQAPK